MYVTHKDAEGFNFEVALNTVFNTVGDGYWSEAAKAVKVENMGMYISTVNDWAEDDCDEECYSDGDFYVTYDESTWDMDTEGLIYTDSLFLTYVQTALTTALVNMGVDAITAKQLAEDVNYSEQGMQDYGRVSFDAYALAKFLRGFYATQTA